MTEPEVLSDNIGWILRCSASDGNYDYALPRLTDEELRYCLDHDTRKGSLRKLRREAKRRGLEVG